MLQPPLLRRAVFFAATLLSLASLSRAAITRDSVLEVTVSTSPVSPHLTLSWPAVSNAHTTNAPKLWRRVKGSTAAELAITLPIGATGYVDSTALRGVTYEYTIQFQRSIQPNFAYGAIVAGCDVPLVENRGNALLYIDASQADALRPEIDQLETDLVADGWKVIRHLGPRSVYENDTNDPAHFAARSAERTTMRATIKGYHDADPGAHWALFILGRAPVAYSGSNAPDGHGDHLGAWPTDTYYGDIDGVWTDSTVNTTFAYDPRNHNVPGDGKFDTTGVLTGVELMTGRVDLANMSGTPGGMTETQLLRQYLVRAHRFRRGLAPYDTVARRALIDDTFNYDTFPNTEAFASSGWRIAIGFFGRDSGQVDDLDWFTTLPTTPMLFAYGAGGGRYTSARETAASSLFARFDSKAVFTLLFGSYFGDWDTPDNLLRAPLAGTANSLGLSCAWSGRGYVFMQHMAMGDPIGYCIRYTQNNSIAQVNGGWFGNGYNRSITYNLMGDPTLRLHTVRPPARLSASDAPGGGVRLAWTASPDATSGYHVYRADSAAGPFTRLTGVATSATDPAGSPVTGAEWTDSTATPGVARHYLVKAVKIESSPSGTYANQSLGVAASITPGSGAPIAPTNLAVVAAGATTNNLSWLDLATDETGYEVQRHDIATTSWATLATLPAGSTAYADVAAPAGLAAHYRVRALGASVHSAWSATAADHALPGLTRTVDRVVVDKTAGQASIPVSRFNGARGAVSVNYATTPHPGYAGISGTDYTATTGTLSWAHGETSAKSAIIPVANRAGPQLTKFTRIAYASPTNGLGVGNEPHTLLLIRDSTAATLPAGWLTQATGTIAWSGYAEHVDGVWGIAAQTADCFEDGWVDSMRFVYQPVVGDCTLTVRLRHLPDTSYGVTCGVMIRETLHQSARMRAIFGHKTASGWTNFRSTPNSSARSDWVPAGANYWYRINRTGNVVRTYYSANGSSWTEAGTAVTLSLSDTAYVGFFMGSNSYENSFLEEPLAYAQFDNVTLVSALGPPAGFAARSGDRPGEIALSWTAVPNAQTYELQRAAPAGDFATVATITAPASAHADAGLSVGQTYRYRLRALTSSGASAYSAEASATPWLPASYAGWRYIHWGVSEDAAVSGPAADPDGDGRPNLLEYASGSSPLLASAAYPEAVGLHHVNGQDHLTLSFVRDPAVPDVAWSLLAANELTGTTWTRIDPLLPANQVSVQNDTPAPGLQRITAKDTQPLSASPRRFLRLEAALRELGVLIDFEPGSGYASGASVVGVDDLRLPGSGVWRPATTAATVFATASPANPRTGALALRIDKPSTQTSAVGAYVDLAPAGVDMTRRVTLEFSMAVTSFSAGTGYQAQVFLGQATAFNPFGAKYWFECILDNGQLLLFRRSTDNANTSVNIGALDGYADLGRYVTFEVTFDPVLKVFERVVVSGHKKTSDLTSTFAGVVLPWIPGVAGDPPLEFIMLAGSNDTVLVDFDDIRFYNP